MSQPAYLVARSGRTVYVRALGLANMKNAPVLDTFLETELGQQATTICVDLSTCSGMDSTFMGVLVGYARQLEGESGRLVILNPTPDNLRLLTMLGVTQVVSVLENPQHIPALDFVSLECDPRMSPMQRLNLVQRAHQHLVKLNDANQEKFSAFLGALERDLAKLRRDG